MTLPFQLPVILLVHPDEKTQLTAPPVCFPFTRTVQSPPWLPPGLFKNSVRNSKSSSTISCTPKDFPSW